LKSVKQILTSEAVKSCW